MISTTKLKSSKQPFIILLIGILIIATLILFAHFKGGLIQLSVYDFSTLEERVLMPDVKVYSDFSNPTLMNLDESTKTLSGQTYNVGYTEYTSGNALIIIDKNLKDYESITLDDDFFGSFSMSGNNGICSSSIITTGVMCENIFYPIKGYGVQGCGSNAPLSDSINVLDLQFKILEGKVITTSFDERSNGLINYINPPCEIMKPAMEIKYRADSLITGTSGGQPIISANVRFSYALSSIDFGQTCIQNELKCTGNNLEICFNNQFILKETCKNGCENNACKKSFDYAPIIVIIITLIIGGGIFIYFRKK